MTNPTTKEKFVNWITGMPISLFDAASSVFTPAGANATIGLVPQPGASVNNPPFYLGDNGIWTAVPTPTLVDTKKFAIVFVIDGGGVAPTTGVVGDIYIPWLSTITRWTILNNISGSNQLDLWKIAYASFPATITNTITAMSLPATTSAVSNQDSTLSGWTTAVSAGNTIRLNLNSVTTTTRITFILELTKTNI